MTIATRALRRTACMFVGLMMLLSASSSVQAQGLVRDAEIEEILQRYTFPLFQAAGLSPSSIEIFLLNDPSLNAFVTPGNRMFIHTGLLMKARTPSEVIGVMAHETGHIAARHYLGRSDEIRSASIKALAAQLLAIGAAIAAGDARAGAAVGAAGQDFALKGLLAYTRGQEQSADQAAVKLLTATEQSPAGLRDFLMTLQDQEVLLAINQDPYLTTHPLTMDRINFLQRATDRSPYGDRVDSALFVEMHERMRAKLIGFLLPQQQVLKLYPREVDTVAARYARAISTYRAGRIDEATEAIDALVALEPQNPFFHELKGQILFENHRLEEALPSYRASVELRPDDAQLRLNLARTLIELNRPEFDKEALEHVTLVLAKEPYNPTAWRVSAIGHGRGGDEGMAALSLAEMYAGRRNWIDAGKQAGRALKLLAENTPAWLRASDIQIEAERQAARRNN